MKPLPQATLKPQGKVIEKERSACSSASLSHSGILLCQNCYWNPIDLPNGHVAIIGTSGSGKTQTLKSLTYELPELIPNVHCIIIDFHGDLELPNEICYPLDMESPYGINPLTIDLDTKGGGPSLQAISVATILRKALVMALRRNRIAPRSDRYTDIPKLFL